MNTKSFLTVDFGAGSLKLAEFEVNEAGSLVLRQFIIKPLGAEGAQETKRETLVLKALQEILPARGPKYKTVNVCAPGFHVFSKFVKLPPVDSGKVTQMIQYEAQQNVPFPLAEVVWDYQILGTTSSGELEVLLVAIKSDIVEGLFRVTETAGVKLQLCDVSPAALCNAFRYNYGDLEDCTMLLDIGAKTSNLLFFEKGKVFARSISLGANSITQDFANESKLKFDVAEKVKIDEGFVSLGGAYEEPENPHQAAISKIARQFMTRLHIQVNQTLQFYRGQQGGSAPARLFLAGGAAIMPYTAQFFAEKLNVPVEYFNPFRSVQIDAAVNLEELSPVAHSLGEIVGLALRNLAHCPVELNLMPESTLRWQSFNEKKPYFIGTVALIVLMAFAVGFLFEKLAGVKKEQLDRLAAQIAPLAQREARFKTAWRGLQGATNDLHQLTDWVEERFYWGDLLRDLRGALLRTEELTKRRLGTDTGVWIEQLIGLPLGPGYGDPGLGLPGMTPDPYGRGEEGMMPGMMPGMASSAEHDAFLQRYGIRQAPAEQDTGMATPPPGEGELGPDGLPVAPAAAANPNEISTLRVLCRGVNLAHVAPAANTDVAFALETELKNLALLDPEGTALQGDLTVDDATGTFTFGMTFKLKRPLKL